MASSARFDSMAELRKAHTDLLNHKGAAAEAIDAFISRSAETGKVLDAKEDRAAAQGLINFWIARLGGAEEAKPASTALRYDDTFLEPYDASTLLEQVAKAEAWLATQGDEMRAMARRVVLRLVRMQPVGPQFLPVSTVRAALNDLESDWPGSAGAAVDALVVAGVIRETPSEEPSLNRLALRSPELITKWPTLGEWLGKRRSFRDRVADSKAGTSVLAEGDELKEARSYGDRNQDEREYVNRSVYAQQKELEQAAANRRWKYLLAGLLSVAVIGWILAAYSARWAKRKAVEADANAIAARCEAEEANTAKAALQIESAKVITTQHELAEQKTQEESAKRQALENRQHLTDLRLLLRTLADMIAAPTYAEYRLAETRWDKFTEQIATREEYAPLRTLNIQRLKANVETREFTSKEDGEKHREDIAQLRKLRDSFRTESVSISALQLAREQSYAVVAKCATELVRSLRTEPSYSRALPYVRTFWSQYWGEMLLVEDPDVEKAMVAFGEVLAKIQLDAETPDTAQRNKVENLLKPYWNNGGKELNDGVNRLNAAALSKLRGKSENVPAEVLETIQMEAGTRSVSGASIRVLESRLKPLLQALNAERLR